MSIQELKCGVKIGKDVSVEELQHSYDAIYAALGARQGVSLGMEGEDAPNVFAGVDFLNRFHHGEKLDLGSDVVVIVVGGGDTAIDSARTGVTQLPPHRIPCYWAIRGLCSTRGNDYRIGHCAHCRMAGSDAQVPRFPAGQGFCR